MNKKTVTILGATGFVGIRLATLLNERGYHVKALTRRKCRHKQLLVLSNVDLIETDTHDQNSLKTHFAGSDTVINLVGILNEGGSTTHTFENAHVELVKKAVCACKEAGVEQYLHMSALNADALKGSSEYLKSKGRGEDAAFALAGQSLRVTSFRPSVIFGEEDSFFNRFAGLLRLLPWFPLACGDSKLSPVYIGDVCYKFIAALESTDYDGKKIEIVGPKDYTLMELVKYTADTIGVEKPIIALPDWMARLQAKVMEWVPGKPFSTDNYNSLQTDSISSDESARESTPIEVVVPTYLGSKNRNNRLQSFRKVARR